MLSIFPSLLAYQQLSPFIIRLVLGAIFVYWAYRGFKHHAGSTRDKTVSIIEIILGILIIIGLWTQMAALVAVIDLIIRLIGRMQKRAFLTDGVNYYLILLVLSLSLLVTGAGAFAFDLSL
jgi:uncharacterized membrane protein YphA (DoxX/SURF4 family)